MNSVSRPVTSTGRSRLGRWAAPVNTWPEPFNSSSLRYDGIVPECGESRSRPDHQRRRRISPRRWKFGRDIEVRPDRRRPEHDAVHVEEQPASLDLYTALGGCSGPSSQRWALIGFTSIEITGLFGLLLPGH